MSAKKHKRGKCKKLLISKHGQSWSLHTAKPDVAFENIYFQIYIGLFLKCGIIKMLVLFYELEKSVHSIDFYEQKLYFHNFKHTYGMHHLKKIYINCNLEHLSFLKERIS